MQELSPRLKEIQEKYKSNPQMMQKKMGEFYQEHKFNPFGGCFPLLLQMPIFIFLYSALVSPQFIDTAGKTSFLFIKRLDNPIKSHAGIHGDKIFGVQEKDTFSTDKLAKVYLKDGKVQEVNINNPQKQLEVQGEIIPGKPVDFKMDVYRLKLDLQDIDKIDKAQIKVINNSTKELEILDFKKQYSLLFAQANTIKAETIFHFDVLVLVLIFGATMFISQKVMTASSKNTPVDPTQQEMQKTMSMTMPFMVTGMFLFFPIPAGVLLYMIVSNIIQVIQTVAINNMIDNESEQKTAPIVNKLIDMKTSEILSEVVDPGEEESSLPSLPSKKSKKHKW
jgi:YidC/Oxa1 family membrane protein insertase